MLRKVSLGLTSHVVLPEQKIAAVSFLSGDEGKLRDLLKSAEGSEDVQRQIKGEDGWVLVHAESALYHEGIREHAQVRADLVLRRTSLSSRSRFASTPGMSSAAANRSVRSPERTRARCSSKSSRIVNPCPLALVIQWGWNFWLLNRVPLPKIVV